MKIFGFEIKRTKKQEPLLTEQEVLIPEQIQEDKKEYAKEENILITKPSPGRQTFPVDVTSVSALDIAVQAPDYDTRYLTALEHLGAFHPDISYAVDNIINLSNTKYSIEFEDTVAPEQRKQMIKHITTKMKKWYPYSSGKQSLINDLLTQVCLYGALSAEMVVNDKLTGVKEVVKVSPKQIKFRYDAITGEWLVFQELTSINIFNRAALQTEGQLNLLKLNTNTYKYVAMRKIKDTPYALPPFLSALEGISIQQELVNSFAYLAKKMGLMGFLSVLVQMPTKDIQRGETEEAYIKRCQDFLAEAATEAEKGFTKGFVTGFKGQHEFDVTTTNQNPAGSKDLLDISGSMVANGVHQDPAMLGRTFSTTETFARVIFAKLSTGCGNYQEVIAGFLEDLFMMELLLAGFKFGGSLKVVFERPLIGDVIRDETAYTMKIANVKELYNLGIINLQQASEMLGFEKPDQMEPRFSAPGSKNKAEEDGTEDDPVNGKTTEKQSNNKRKRSYPKSMRYISSLGGNVAEYDYGSGCSCESCGMLEDSFKDAEVTFSKRYKTLLKGKYATALIKIMPKIQKGLLSLPETFSEQMFKDVVISVIYQNWNKRFAKPSESTIKQQVNKIYSFYRQDKTIFGDKKADYVQASFNLSDMRAMDYFKTNDKFYLGKFITDSDTQTRLNDFLKQEYLISGSALGKNKEMISQFRSRLTKELIKEDWKIERIIDTSVNKMRNYGALNYMKQVDIVEFKIAGIPDRKQCAHCQALRGMVFNVSVAHTTAETVTKGRPEDTPLHTPFVNTIYKAEDIKAVGASVLQSQGIGLPPFHCNCRDKIVANI